MKSITPPKKSILEISLKGYVLQKEIGKGGFGTVYRAEQISTGQSVAVKIFTFREPDDLKKRNQNIARFERETQICAEINHPHIVKLLDKGYTDDQEPFAVFEYVSGETLKNLILQNGGLSVKETGELMGQVLDALACAHIKGIVHRDLKPDNIMVMKTGSRLHVKVLDFGISVFTQDVHSIDYKKLTLTQEALGTPTYCAPEQLRGEPPTVKSDLYAWGLILIECLTGEPVMKGNSAAEVFQQQLNSSNVPLPPAVSGHPLADILRRVLDKDARFRAGEATGIFEEYTNINFHTLIGKIQTERSPLQYAGENLTCVNHFEWRKAYAEKKQITVLSIKLSLSLSNDSLFDMETWDAIQKDQLNLCKDTAIRFGGYIAGSLADNVLVYFGYPQVNDNDARRAGRTALDLIVQVQKRSALLNIQNGIRLSIRIGMNSGIVLSHPGQTPEGLVPNSAFNLAHCAEPNTVLVTALTKKLLDPYLEFKESSQHLLYNNNQPIQSYCLIGERQTEAFSFLRPGNADRKMVGREQEKKQVLDLWDQIITGNGKALLVTGPPGIGKSKLIYESKKQLRADGFMVHECRCLPEHKNNALYPVFEMLKRHMGFEDTMDPVIALNKLEIALQHAGIELQLALPVFCSWLIIPIEERYHFSAVPPDQQKRILFDSLKKLIFHLGSQNKFLLLVEDLHWIDPTSLDFLRELNKSIADGNVLLLMTARPEFNPEWKKEITCIELQTLSKIFTKELIEEVLHQRTIEAKALAYIDEKADGVPLFIEELTNMLREKKYLIAENEHYHLLKNIEEKNVPVTLHDLLNARLDRLGFAKETAQIAATIGREFSYDLLVKVSLRDEAMVQADLEQLLSTELVYRQRRVQTEMYIFRHALIRDAAYTGMIKTTQEHTHLKIAEVMEAGMHETDAVTDAVQLEILADHLFEGKRITDGINRLIQAFEMTKQQSANQETIALCSKALKWLQCTTNEKKMDLLIRKVLLSALMAAEGYGATSVGEELSKIQEVCVELDDKEQLFSTMCIKVNHELCREDWRAATEAALYFYNAALRQDQPKWIISSSIMLGQQYFLNAKFKEAAMLLEKAMSLYDSKMHRNFTYEFGVDQGILAASMLCCVYYFLDRLDEVPQLEKLAFKWADELNHKHTRSLLYYSLSCFYFYKGDKLTVKKYFVQLDKDNQGTTPDMFTCLTNTLFFWANEDLLNLKRAVVEQEAMGIAPMRTFWYTIIASLEIEMGNYADAKKWIIKTIAFIGKSDGHLYEAELYYLYGLSYIGLNKEKEGVKQLQRSKTIALKQGAAAVVKKVDAILGSLSPINVKPALSSTMAP